MTLSASARRVQDALRDAGFAGEVVELAASTRTSAEGMNSGPTVGFNSPKVLKGTIRPSLLRT